MRALWIVALVLLPEFVFGAIFSLHLENDLWSNSDQHYTHGTRVTFQQDASSAYVAGQYIYTPQDIEATERITNDRPFAAWLYVGKLWTAGVPEKYGVYEIDIGIIGPAAGGEDTQRALHELASGRDPNGWDNQLPNEPTIEVSYRQVWEIRKMWDNWGIRLRPYGVGALGNVMTFIGAGGVLYAGYNPPDALLSPVILLKEAKPSLSAAVFLGTEGRLMLYNKFIEGSAYHDITKEPWVGDATVGVHVGYKGLSVDLSQNFRSEEFKEQDGSHEFTSLALRYSF